MENYEVYISEITITEIDRTPDPALQNKMKMEISQLSVLLLSDEVERLANEYIDHGAIPEGYSEDAYHIAIAVLNEIDFP